MRLLPSQRRVIAAALVLCALFFVYHSRQERHDDHAGELDVPETVTLVEEDDRPARRRRDVRPAAEAGPSANASALASQWANMAPSLVRGLRPLPAPSAELRDEAPLSAG